MDKFSAPKEVEKFRWRGFAIFFKSGSQDLWRFNSFRRTKAFFLQALGTKESFPLDLGARVFLCKGPLFALLLSCASSSSNFHFHHSQVPFLRVEIRLS